MCVSLIRSQSNFFFFFFENLKLSHTCNLKQRIFCTQEILVQMPLFVTTGFLRSKKVLSHPISYRHVKKMQAKLKYPNGAKQHTKHTFIEKNKLIVNDQKRHGQNQTLLYVKNSLKNSIAVARNAIMNACIVKFEEWFQTR